MGKQTEKTKTLSIIIPAELRKRLKVAAAERDIQLAAFVIMAIEAQLKKRGNGQ